MLSSWYLLFKDENFLYFNIYNVFWPNQIPFPPLILLPYHFTFSAQLHVLFYFDWVQIMLPAFTGYGTIHCIIFILWRVASLRKYWFYLSRKLLVANISSIKSKIPWVLPYACWVYHCTYLVDVLYICSDNHCEIMCTMILLNPSIAVLL